MKITKPKVKILDVTGGPWTTDEAVWIVWVWFRVVPKGKHVVLKFSHGGGIDESVRIVWSCDTERQGSHPRD